MRRELKRDQALAPSSEMGRDAKFVSRDEPSRGDGNPTGGASGASGARERRFDALDPEAVAPPPKRSRDYPRAGVPLVVVSLLLLVVLRSVWLRALLPLTLGIAAVISVLRGRRLEQEAPQGPRRGLTLDGNRLLFRGAVRTESVLSTTAPFGVTLLAAPRRDRLVALLSSSLGTFYVGGSFTAADRRALAPLLDRATTVGSDDVALESIGPDGAPLLLAPEELAALLDVLVNASPACLERFILTDAHGHALCLDGRVLCAGDRIFDLAAPLEWRAIVFQEAFGHAVAVYQGTWIRQSSSELVLVSLLPSLSPAIGPELDLDTLDRAALRDIRLMQASPEQPPPSEQRIAIDRLFMLPLRSALDRAPRAVGLLKKSASP